MFEKEIEFIYKYNLNKIKHLGSFITYEQLLATNIHPALLQYLSAEIDFLIYEDRQKLLKDSLFDYSGEKITEYFSSIGEEIKKTKKFSFDYLSKLLLHATSFNTNFIIRPKWSLMQFVFENENESTKQIVEVKQILNYVYYYPFLKRLLINFFNKKRMVTLSSDELESLLNKIDKINYESNFDKVLDTTFSSMAEFIYAGELNNQKISKQLVELFLLDKSLDKLKLLIDEKFGFGNKNKFDIIEFKNILLNAEENENTEDDILQEEQIEQSEVTFENKSAQEIDDDYEKGEIETQELPIEEPNTEAPKELLDDEPKSFLQSHIETIEQEVDDLGKIKNEELEPPELDEDRRIDEKNIDEIYELATEEEELNSFAEVDELPLARIEIDESSDPLETKINNINMDSEEDEQGANEKSNDEEQEKGFIKLGSSITFSANDLVSKLDDESNDIDNKEDNDGWASESSNKLEDNYESDLKIEEENNVSDFIIDNPNSKIIEEIDSLLDENDENEIDFDDNEIETEEETEPLLFSKEELEDTTNNKLENSESIVENSEKTISNNKESYNLIDISKVLDNKKIPKIIEVVFDYDMEDFANAIEEISEAKSEAEAHNIIDVIAKKAFVDSSIKEIKVFKNIISEFYK